MNLKQIGLLLLVIPLFLTCGSQPGRGGKSGSGIVLTIGDKIDLSEMVPARVSAENRTWESSDPDVASVNQNGVVTAVSFSAGGTSRFSPQNPATGTAVITVRSGNSSHSFSVTATMVPQTDMLTLPPMKDTFKDFFLMGNIIRGPNEISGSGANARINNQRLVHHYNAITAENHMKPGYLVTGRNASTGAFSWNTENRNFADNLINAANNAGMKVIGHTLLWHSQNPDWVWNQIAGRDGTRIADRNQALAIMRAYITEVASRYKGKIYSWDVLNEIFPDNASGTNWETSMRRGAQGEGQAANPWLIAIGPDFVYEAFLATRLADPEAILYYNDYNTDMPVRAMLIRNMVNDVNTRYLALPANQKPAGEARGRLLIEGIGMQEHHNNGITAARISTTINLFRPLGVKLAVSELDIIAFSNYREFSNAGGTGVNNHNISNVTNTALLIQANRYREYMGVYLANSDIIERVTLWGVVDSQSWRSRGLPLLFDHYGRAKPAYYHFVGALP
ncbi:MAG: endo-1,4-beta-xylanase [Treponema sp.]|nr:endo-1,4-beta-xylanase [Treponema sp.]